MSGENSTYRHKKKGSLYCIEQVVKLEAGRSEGGKFWDYTVTDDIPGGTYAVLYRNIATWERWARPAEMFFDGRFERVAETGATLPAEPHPLSSFKELEGLAADWEGYSEDGMCHEQWRECRAACALELRAVLTRLIPPVSMPAREGRDGLQRADCAELVEGEGTATSPNLMPVFELLQSAGLDPVILNVARLDAGESGLTDEGESLQEMVELLLARVAKAEAKGKLLAEEFDSLRLKYAEMSGQNATIQHKLAHAAKKHGSAALQGLVRDMRAESKTQVLQRLPTGNDILKALEAGL